MQRIELLSRIFRNSPHEEGTIDLYPTGSGCSVTEMCSDGEYDLSYEDALVDTQARLFFRSELGREEAARPGLAFTALMERIEAEPRLTDAAPLPVGAARVGTDREESRWRRGLSGSLVSRLIPSTVALLLVFMALGTDVAQYLRPSSGPDGMRTFAERRSGSLTVQQEVDLLRRPYRPIRVAPRLGSVPPSAAIIHPVEMGMKPNERDAWAQAAPHAFTYYERGAHGPE